MVNHILTRVQDKYYIENLELDDIQYKLTKLNKITGDTVISEGIIEAGATFEVPITVDGKYTVLLTENDEGGTSLLELDYYVNLQLSAIEDIFTVLCPCDCGCNGCSDEDSDCCDIVRTKDKIETYNMLLFPLFASYFSVVYEEVISLISKQVYCIINEESLYGSSTFNNKLSKQLIAANYLAWYLYEFQTYGTSEENISYIKTKFRQEEIYCCIHKLGIDLKSIEDALIP